MSSSTKRVKFSLLCLALICCCQSTNAQGLTGQISGTVTDDNGAVVANATLKLTNAQTGQIRATSSSSDGRFVFPELLPGSFTLTVEASGFKKYEQAGLAVSAAERVTLPAIALQTGQVS